LAQVTRSGMHLNREQVERLHADYEQRLEGIVETFLRDFPGVIKLDRQSKIQTTRKSGTPSVREKVLRDLLVQAAQQVRNEQEVAITIPRAPKGAVSTSAKEWAPYADRHPLIKLWVEKEKVSKLCEFFGGLKQAVIHPKYNLLTRTGRT